MSDKLLPCHDCATLISPNAMVCPKCGAPTLRAKQVGLSIAKQHDKIDREYERTVRRSLNGSKPGCLSQIFFWIIVISLLVWGIQSCQSTKPLPIPDPVPQPVAVPIMPVQAPLVEPGRQGVGFDPNAPKEVEPLAQPKLPEQPSAEEIAAVKAEKARLDQESLKARAIKEREQTIKNKQEYKARLKSGR